MDSDCNPQLENGYLKIANELWDAMLKVKLNDAQRKCLGVIIRQTYGFNRKACMISTEVFIEKTGILKANISRTLSELKTARIIKTVIQMDNKRLVTYSINKKYLQWKTPKRKKLLSKRITSVIQMDNGTFKDNINTKEVPKTKKMPFKTKIHNEKITFFDNKKSTVFKIPTREIIKEASVKRIKADTGIICDALYYNKIFLKAPIFRNAMLKKKKNPRAILHTLIACYRKACKEPFEIDQHAYAYCNKIIQVENGNYNEREYKKTNG